MALIECGGCQAVHESALPVCPVCGRCHICGAVRFSAMKPHACGFPVDPERIRSVEQSFGLQRRHPGKN